MTDRLPDDPGADASDAALDSANDPAADSPTESIAEAAPDLTDAPRLATR